MCASACHETEGDWIKSIAPIDVGDGLYELLDVSLRLFAGDERYMSSRCPVEFDLPGTDCVVPREPSAS